MFSSNLSPKKHISSINMYLICHISSWKLVNLVPSNSLNSLIGILDLECIVDALILNVATPIGASKCKGD